jgi:hypothetical protein
VRRSGLKKEKIGLTIRQARTGNAVLVNSREMTGRTQILPWWLGEGRVKTTENKVGKRGGGYNHRGKDTEILFILL